MWKTINTRLRYYSSPRYPQKGRVFFHNHRKRIREQYHLHLASTLLASGKKVKETNLTDWLQRSRCTFRLEKRYERVFYSWWWLGLLVRGIIPCDWARYQRHAAVSQRGSETVKRRGGLNPSQCWGVELCVRCSGCKDMWGEAFSSVCRGQCTILPWRCFRLSDSRHIFWIIWMIFNQRPFLQQLWNFSWKYLSGLEIADICDKSVHLRI